MEKFFSHLKYKTIHHTDQHAAKTISDYLITLLPRHIDHIIILCIGTDRSTGDALGPLTGTFFSQHTPKFLKVYGTLHDPVHALNLEEKIKLINHKYNNPFIIAIDASLGKTNSIGHLISNEGSLLPGAALKKNLPAVGDAYITGVVNASGSMHYNVLQSTKLSIVYDMAAILSNTLLMIETWYERYTLNRKPSLYVASPRFKINGRCIQ